MAKKHLKIAKTNLFYFCYSVFIISYFFTFFVFRIIFERTSYGSTVPIIGPLLWSAYIRLEGSTFMVYVSCKPILLGQRFFSFLSKPIHHG